MRVEAVVPHQSSAYTAATLDSPIAPSFKTAPRRPNSRATPPRSSAQRQADPTNDPGEVSEQGIVRLLEGRDPATGQLLGRAITGGAVAGFDLTFRAPKSVGILSSGSQSLR